MMRLIRYFLLMLLALVLIPGGLIFIAGITDYRPEQKSRVYSDQSPDVIADSARVNLMIWNIGFCGLGDDMDFFYDGGSGVRSSRNRVQQNCRAILSLLEAHDSIDFYLLQEVDKRSKRSYRINQYERLKNRFPDYTASFGKNYDVFFVPLPFHNPLGKVTSGLTTLSIYTPGSSARYSFKDNYSFPLNWFMLDRCFLVNRYPVSNGKTLLIINTHNSAYDNGSLKKAQMDQLKLFLTEEYSKGNYLIAGGDWNQLPPGYDPQFKDNASPQSLPPPVPDHYLPAGWKWVYDNRVPTNRGLERKYHPAKSVKRVIDYYLISPNIQCLDVKGMDLGFGHSDHQPVVAKFKLMQSF